MALTNLDIDLIVGGFYDRVQLMIWALENNLANHPTVISRLERLELVQSVSTLQAHIFH